MSISERDEVRKIYGLSEIYTVRDLITAFEMNPCKRARDFIVRTIEEAVRPHKYPRDPDIRKFYEKVRSTPCKY